MKQAIMRGAMLALALGGASATVVAQELPQRKPGLWEMTMQSPQMPQPMTTQQCIDDKTDAQMQRRAMQSDASCGQPSITKVANGYAFSSVCKRGTSTATMKGTSTGDFNSAYKVDMNTRFDPPQNGMQEMNMSMTARHAGACPAGMKPGDMKVNDMVVNMSGQGAAPSMSKEDMAKMMEQMKKQMEQKK